MLEYNTCKILYIFFRWKAFSDMPRTVSWLKIAFPKEGKGPDRKANTIQSLKTHSVKMLAWSIQRFETLISRVQETSLNPLSLIYWLHELMLSVTTTNRNNLPFKWEISSPVWNWPFVITYFHLLKNKNISICYFINSQVKIKIFNLFFSVCWQTAASPFCLSNSLVSVNTHIHIST